MSLQHIAAQLEAWRASLSQEATRILGRARAQLVSAQTEDESDERIAKIETLALAELEPVFLKADDVLSSMRTACEQYFERTEEPTEADRAVQERVEGATDQVRDHVGRKLSSLVAQARAQELAPIVNERQQSSAPSAACPRCGSALTAGMLATRRCPFCQAQM